LILKYVLVRSAKNKTDGEVKGRLKGKTLRQVPQGRLTGTFAKCVERVKVKEELTRPKVTCRIIPLTLSRGVIL
jgi:hypothetical protein